ncbi:DUF1918 domain-containing protein [Nonomuraea sp. NPDC048916]
MKAAAGDRLIVEGAYGGNTRREGFVAGVLTSEPTPPEEGR